MKVLFIGGTGIISSACVRLAVDTGIELYVLNRGTSTRDVPAGARVLKGDIRDRASAEAALGTTRFDVVVNWVAYTPDHVEHDLSLFGGKVGQYIFISSASVYQTPPSHLPVTESTPLHNPFWDYSRAKIACEQRLERAYREDHFPVTVVRPSHTYDERTLPLHGGYTMIDRMRRGKKIVVHGDGSSLWVLTHHRDFAKGFIGLLGNRRTIGDTFHITSDELLTWNQIADQLAYAAGTQADIVHVSSDVIAKFDPEWGAGLLGDKTHSMIFDNSKIKRLVPGFAATIPFSRGAEEIMRWYDADESRRTVDEALNSRVDEIIAVWQSSTGSVTS